MFTHILMATDGSEHALKAAACAAEIAQKFGSEVTLLCVFNPPLTQGPQIGVVDTPVDPAVIARYGEEVQEAVERRTGQVFEQYGVAYQARREVGHPADMIIAIAARSNADLIVMGSRGLAGLQSFLLGSVSERVLRHAHCPVLIVK